MQQVNRCYKGKYIRITPIFWLLLFTCLITTSALAAPSDDFVTTWKTGNSDTSITVPMVGGPFDVDWDDDGSFDEFGVSGSVTHDYGVTGIFTIRIRGVYDSIRSGGAKILSVDQWGTNSWTSMEGAFSTATNLTIPAIDTPDFFFGNQYVKHVLCCHES